MARRISRPMIYSFIPYPFNQGVVNRGVLQVTSEQAEGPDGILLPAGGAYVQFAINTPSELYSRALWLRFSAHTPTPNTALFEGSRGFSVLQDQTAVLPETIAAINAVVPWASFVELTVAYMVRGTRDVMGGQAQTDNGARMATVPVQATSMEQSMDGMGQVRLRGVIPPKGQILIKARNTHPTEALRISGHVMSYVFPQAVMQ